MLNSFPGIEENDEEKSKQLLGGGGGGGGDWRGVNTGNKFEKLNSLDGTPECTSSGEFPALKIIF